MTTATMTPTPSPPAEVRGLVRGPHPPAARNRALGRKVAAGNAARDALEARGAIPDPRERRKLLRAVRAGLEARRALVVGNTALAVRLGSRAAARQGREPADAIGDALLGLVKAGSTYDPDRFDAAFSTHAVWQIFGALSHGAQRSPASARLRDGRTIYWGTGAGGVVDMPDPDPEPEADEDREHAADMPDPEPEADEDREHAADRLARLMARLTDRQREVIARRHGLGGHEPHTLAAIGRALGVTKERIRQIEKKAMDRLRRAAGVGPDARGGPDGDGD
jgi:RNA polymerase primary sigma factor